MVIKSSLIETLFVSWEDVVVVSAIANNTPKGIVYISSTNLYVFYNCT